MSPLKMLTDEANISFKSPFCWKKNLFRGSHEGVFLACTNNLMSFAADHLLTNGNDLL